MPALVSASLAAALFQKACPSGGAVASAVRVPQALSHEVWFVDTATGRYVLKIPRVHTGPACLRNAVAAQRLAACAGMPGPRILAWDEGALLGRPLYVQELLRGQDAETAWGATSPPARVRFSDSFGQAVARVHSIVGPRVGSADVAVTAPSWPAHLQSYLSHIAERIQRLSLLPAATLGAAVGRMRNGIADLSGDV